MKTISILFIILLTCVSCASTTTRIDYGTPTFIHSVNHCDDGDNYSALTIAEQHGSWETNLSYHNYKVNKDDFSTISIGIKYHLTKQFGWWIIDGGIGLRLTEADHRNVWLAHSNILGDLSISTGVKKDFESFSLTCLYSFQHLSVPFRHDRGLNYDSIQFGISIPF